MLARSIFLLPLREKGARRADEGYSVTATLSSAEERVPLTLEFLLNAEIPVPLPQGARGGSVGVVTISFNPRKTCPNREQIGSWVSK